ncbi:hypothetical protein HUW62_30890 [Myxococcus sp. AM011]|uniref:hypothetical protein n=1 Tax=Myxococcus sp. AM011 TaxID=2745200 RepID=UPI001595990B|nr:hypothetical protein [Myxococcus sp. AM011]NVJ25638.1 hypothetical protein [Myxococcus sp. AM011]
MRNGSQVVVGMLLVAGWVACATRTREPVSATEAGQASMALDAPGIQAKSKNGCAVDACPADGGTNCLDIAVTATSAGKGFNPKPGKGGWKMCSGQGLVLSSLMDKGLCVDLRDVSTSGDGGVVMRTSLSSEGNWEGTSLPPGKYCLSLCDSETNDCSQGCKKSDCAVQDEQTIRGNIDVVTKVPEPHGAH